MDEDIAERLREENPEQFLILVRMHLSFLIDMNTDENDSPNDKPKSFKWGFSKKFKSSNNTNETNSKATAGPPKIQVSVPLTDENIKQIYQLIDILSLESNLIQEGIFRRTGSLSRQQQLRRLLASGGILDAETATSYSAHDMASVLKGMLADTPEPLLLNQHHQAYCHLATTCFTDSQPLPSSETKLIDAIRLLLLLLPPALRQLVKRLLTLLNKAASFESSNRMSPSALATMFTPHVLCPRRLSPEALHSDSQSLSPVLGFMIKKAATLFVTPPQLATDVAAYLAKKQHQRLLSPNGEDLNESVSERTAASTVFTFVDRQMSGVDVKDGGAATDAALAQLYAYIQSLPESHNKRRLIKQFNRENGHGTPLQLQRAQKQKSLGESLKKHIFARTLMSKTGKKPVNLNDQRFGYHPMIESQSTLKSKLKQSASDMSLNEPKPLMMSNLSIKHDSTIKKIDDTNGKLDMEKNDAGKYETDEELDVFSNTTDDNLDEASFSCDEASNTPLQRVERLTPKYTSEPNLSFLPSNHEITPKYTKSRGSKLFKSKTTLQSNISKKDTKKHDIQKLQKTKRNSMDDKSIKDTSEHSMTFKSCMKCSTDSFSEADCSVPESRRSVPKAQSPRSENTPRLVKKDSLKYMRHKRNMSNRSSLSFKGTTPPGEDENHTQLSYKDEDLCTPKVSLLKPHYLTSTPAVCNILLNNERNYDACSTPMFTGGNILRRGSMSPITKSTQKMPKAMQESIMTPRSRKPVIINCEPATTALLPCPSHMTSHHSVNNATSDSSTTDTVYDTTPSSMKNDSDFVSTDESCPSSSYIKYKHIDDIDASSKDKSLSSGEHFPCISDYVISERRLRSIQERKYQRLLEKKNPGTATYHTDQSKTALLDDKEYSESDSDSSPKLKTVDKNASLTGPFREYLLNRSVLTGSPVDLSFASGPEDYYDSKTDHVGNFSEGKMTDSLLYCMNGNVPADLTINSDFDNSDTVPLLKQSSALSNGIVTKHTSAPESSKNSSTANKYRKLHRNDSISNCDKDPLNKENVSPGIKRPAHNLGNGMDQEVIEIKKVNVSVNQNEKETVSDSNVIIKRPVPEDTEFWDYERYGPLWETNL